MKSSQSTDAVARYLPLLAEQEIDTVDDLFAAKLGIHDPSTSHLVDRGSLRSFLADRQAWLGARDARVELVRTICGVKRTTIASSPSSTWLPPVPVTVEHPDGRTVAEFILHLTVNGKRIGVPVAVSGELDEAGKIMSLRIYHSQQPISGFHEIRSPILSTNPSIRLSNVIARYHRALADGDLESIASMFDQDCHVQGSGGVEHARRGLMQVRAFHERLLANGGISLDPCSVTDDGVCCAVEYNCSRWGTAVLPVQAGIVVVERARRRQRLAGVRYYEDIDRPAPFNV